MSNAEWESAMLVTAAAHATDHQRPMSEQEARRILAGERTFRTEAARKPNPARVQDRRFHNLLDNMSVHRISEDEAFEILAEAHENGNLRPNVRNRFLKEVKDRTLANDFLKLK